jgi:hypothetical protein
MAVPRPIPFFPAPAISRPATPRDLLERCLARFEEFEPASGRSSDTTSARRALPRTLPPSGRT